MKFKCISDWSKLPQNSHSLFLQSEKDSLFFSREWFENLTSTALESEHNLLLACVVDTEKILAILPLIMHPSKEWTSLSHRYSSLYSMFVAKDNQQEILSCLAQGLKQLPFEYLSLDPVADNNPTLNAFQQAMEACGFSCYRTFRFVNWFHRLNGQSFKDYMDTRPSRVRNTIERKQRKLEREQTFEIRLFTEPNYMHQALSEYHELYKASWKAQEQFEELVEGLSARFSRKGWTRLGVLYINGQPAAAHLWFVVHKNASIFRLVYDQKWKQYSPGSILMCAMLEHVIDVDKVEEIDFLTGNDRYKQDWMSESRERKSLVCVNKEAWNTKEKEPLLLKLLAYFRKPN